MTDVEKLFEPLKVGNITVRNRMALAPCTRQRSYLDGVPSELNVEYYRQRASAGLLITEGVYPGDMGCGYLFSPGLTNDAHVEGWARVADAVHHEGGAIFAQIMHVGRLSDRLSLPNHAQPIAPSAVRPDPLARHYTISCPRAKRPYETPRALETEEVYAVIEEYRQSAARARQAGLDGVEIHAASGYLPMQFLSTNVNLREDEFGGSIENRARFLLACVDAMIEATDAGFVAVKVSPGWEYHNVFDTDPVATYTYVVKELSKRGIAYLQVGNYGRPWDVHGTLRPLFNGPYMGVAGYTRSTAAAAIASGQMDMVAFGQNFMANPDLVERYRYGWGLNKVDLGTYYTQGDVGYTNYPFYSAEDAGQLVDVDSPPTPATEPA